jgi:uncharacterized protein YdgA (DUF945 family)
VIEIRFELFPVRKFKEIDDIWRQMNYKFADGSISGGNMGKMENYMENLKFDEGAVKQLIEKYDQEVRSFRLTE